MDNFNDQLAKAVETTGRAALANQCMGRSLKDNEFAFAEQLSLIFNEVGHDFALVAKELKARGVVMPKLGGSDWSVAALEDELKAINTDLDAAYMEYGYGA